MELRDADEGAGYIPWVPSLRHPSPDVATPDVVFQLCLAKATRSEGWLAPTPISDEEDSLLIKRGIHRI